MKQTTKFLTFTAAALCLAVSLNIEAEFYGRFLASILGEGRFAWLPLLAAVTVQVARLATSWNSASFSARGMVREARENLRISGTIAIYETVEISLFGIAYLGLETASAFILFGCFFVWVSFALEIILTRALQPAVAVPVVAPVPVSQGTGVLLEIDALRQRLDALGGATQDRRKKARPSKQTTKGREVPGGNWADAVKEEYNRRLVAGEPVSYQAIATAIGCNKTTAFRILAPLRNE
jgi:hypothetical protein